MKLHTYLTIFFLMNLFLANGQDYSLLAGSKAEGMAHTAVTLDDAFATFHNPSLLAWNENNLLAISGRNHFQVPSMNSAYLAVSFAEFGGNAGLTIQYNGNSSYNDSRFGIYYARPFGDVFAPSLSFNVYQHFVQGYDIDLAFTGDLGLTAKLNDLTLGFFYGNFTNSAWNSGYQEELPSFLRLGAKYNFDEGFYFALETVKVLDGDFGVKGGIEYIIDDIVGLRGGYSTMPEMAGVGISLYLEQFTFDLGITYHSTLGYSPQAAAIYDWSN